MKTMLVVLDKAACLCGSSTAIYSVAEMDEEIAALNVDRLEKLKNLFAEDGITLTDREALEIGLWLIARVQSVLTSVPLDKMALFAKIKNETKLTRYELPFVSLYKSRRNESKKHTNSLPIDVPT